MVHEFEMSDNLEHMLSKLIKAGNMIGFSEEQLSQIKYKYPPEVVINRITTRSDAKKIMYKFSSPQDHPMLTSWFMYNYPKFVHPVIQADDFIIKLYQENHEYLVIK